MKALIVIFAGFVVPTLIATTAFGATVQVQGIAAGMQVTAGTQGD